MPRISRLPLDPTAQLLASIARVIRGGVANCTTITAADNVPWTEGATSPAGHYLVPSAKWHLYLDREPEKVETPALLVLAPEDGKSKPEWMEGMWSIVVVIRALVPRDTMAGAAAAVIARLHVVLTQSLTLDDDTVQSPQARLSTATLHLDGSRREDNFAETATGKVEEVEGHPQHALAFTVTCGLIAA